MITFVLILSLCLGECYCCSPNRASILSGIIDIVGSKSVNEVVKKVEDTWKRLEQEGKHQLRKLVNELQNEGPQDDERQRHEEEMRKQEEQREREQKQKQAEQREREKRDQKEKELKQKQAEQRERERRDQKEKEQKQKQTEQRERERRDQEEKEQKQKQAEQQERERRREEEKQQQIITEKELEEWRQEERERQKKIAEEELREWRIQERKRQQKILDEEFREWRQHERERQQKIVEEKFKEWRRQEEHRQQESVKEEFRRRDAPEEDQHQMTMVEQESERLKQEEKPLRMHRELTEGQEMKRTKQKRKLKIEEEPECKRRKSEDEGQTMMSGGQEKDISKRAKVSQQRHYINAEVEELEICEENEYVWTTGIQENRAISGSNDAENRDAKQDKTNHEDTNLNITLGGPESGKTLVDLMEDEGKDDGDFPCRIAAQLGWSYENTGNETEENQSDDFGPGRFIYDAELLERAYRNIITKRQHNPSDEE